MVADPSPTALVVVLAMSVVTYATKAGGFWALGRLDPSETTRAALDALPGGIVVAIVAVRVVRGGPVEWVAGLVVVAVARRTDSVLLAMVAGLAALVGLRTTLAAR